MYTHITTEFVGATSKDQTEEQAHFRPGWITKSQCKSTSSGTECDSCTDGEGCWYGLDSSPPAATSESPVRASVKIFHMFFENSKVHTHAGRWVLASQLCSHTQDFINCEDDKACLKEMVGKISDSVAQRTAGLELRNSNTLQLMCLENQEITDVEVAAKCGTWKPCLAPERYQHVLNMCTHLHVYALPQKRAHAHTFCPSPPWPVPVSSHQASALAYSPPPPPRPSP